MSGQRQDEQEATVERDTIKAQHHSGGTDWCATCRQYSCAKHVDGPGYYSSADDPDLTDQLHEDAAEHQAGIDTPPGVPEPRLPDPGRGIER